MPTNLTNEEEELSLSAQEAHSLQEMIASNGWGILKEKYFDIRLAEYKRYLYDVKNTDPVMIRSQVMMVDFIETMQNEIIQAIKIGLEDEVELVKRKEKKKKK
uniref:Uncharacterized protein n=1 Tax=viral metagenome TaxID=1070528 RepID=A0A6H1ZNH0_9ZZZZ